VRRVEDEVMSIAQMKTEIARLKKALKAASLAGLEKKSNFEKE
jgi:hypothetical protein